MPKEFEVCAYREGAIPTIGSPPHNFEQPKTTPISNDSPHITIGSESMQINNTNVIVDRTKDPSKHFGTSIVGNIVDYSSSSNEDKGQEPKKEDEPFAKNIEPSIEVATSSVPLVATKITPSTPPTHATVVTVVVVQLDEEDEAQNITSSLSKFLEKKKSVKSIEKTLTLVLDRMEKIVSPIDTLVDIQQRTTILCTSFNDEFSTLSIVATIQAQIEHDV